MKKIILFSVLLCTTLIAGCTTEDMQALNAMSNQFYQQSLQLSTPNIMTPGIPAQPSYNQRHVDVYHCQQVGNMVRCW